MKRITISLPEDLAAALERESQREHMSISEIARKAIEARLGKHSGQGERPVPFASLGRSGRKHTARDMEEILAKEWTVENLIDRNR